MTLLPFMHILDNLFGTFGVTGVQFKQTITAFLQFCHQGCCTGLGLLYQVIDGSLVFGVRQAVFERLFKLLIQGLPDRAGRFEGVYALVVPAQQYLLSAVLITGNM